MTKGEILISLVAGKTFCDEAILMENKNFVKEAKRLIKKCVDIGAVEGLTGEKKYAVDGRELEEDSVCLKDLHDYLKSKTIL